MRTTTLATLRTQVRERADMENSNFVSDAEVNRYISSSYTALYDLLVQANPDFYQKEQTLSGDGSTSKFAVASDYYGTVGIDYLESTGNYRPLIRITNANRNDYDYSAASEAYGYRFVYNTTTPTTPMVQLLPTPANGDTYRHIYTVAPAVLSADGDLVDGIAGWEEYIVYDAAIKCLEKEGTAPASFHDRLAKLESRIQSMAESRTIDDAGEIGQTRHKWGYYYDPATRRLR